MIKKIAVVGPESTGKSELCRLLATEYQSEWVPEYARFYIDRLHRPYEKEDLLEIAKGQLIWEDDKCEYANKWLFCDTNLIVIKIWSDYKYNETDPLILQWLNERKYDFYLLTNIDIPWTPDPQREHPDKRKYFFKIFENYLKDNQLPYAVINGIEEERLECALKSLANLKI